MDNRQALIMLWNSSAPAIPPQKKYYKLETRANYSDKWQTVGNYKEFSRALKKMDRLKVYNAAINKKLYIRLIDNADCLYTYYIPEV